MLVPPRNKAKLTVLKRRQTCRVLDLGSGSGRDCYVCAALVGERGSVTGVDMTGPQLVVANKYLEEYCHGTLGYSKVGAMCLCARVGNRRVPGLGRLQGRDRMWILAVLLRGTGEQQGGWAGKGRGQQRVDEVMAVPGSECSAGQ